MSRSALIACVVALAAVVAWLARGERGGDAREVSGELDSAASREDATPAELLEPGSAPALVERGAELVPNAPPAAEPAGGAAGGTRADATPAELTISGLVDTGHPLPDEEILVEADVYVGVPFSSGSRVKRRARVERDGSFVLAVPADARFALLDVEAPSLQLDEGVRAKPGERGVLLEPRAFAHLTLRVTLPPDVIVPADDPWRDVRGHGGVRFASGTSASCKDGVIELRRVETGAGFQATVEQPYGPLWTAWVEPLAPGEHRELAVELEGGMTVSGRVLDEHGEPVAHAVVDERGPEESKEIPPHVHGLQPGSYGDLSVTDAAGAFWLQRLRRARTTIRVSGRLASGAEVEVDGRAGDVDGLVLRVERGLTIRGHVAWRDGRPAAGAKVRVVNPLGAGVRAGADGAFEIPALRVGVYDLEAGAKEDAHVGRARVAGVPAGRDGVALVLVEEPRLELRGVVVDERGGPIAAFHAFWRSAASSGDASASARAANEFVLDELPPDELEVEVSAPGYVTETQSARATPDAQEPLRFVLRSAALVRGRVLDARGEPVSGARVEASSGVAGHSDREGRFALPPGAATSTLTASKRGHAPSEGARIELRAGEVVEDVVLRLREPCRVRGRVLDAGGKPVEGARVTPAAPGYAELDPEWTDPDGRFELDGLAPGALLEARNGEALARATVVVGPGGIAEVELRFSPTDPVKLTGRVTRAGAPLEGWVGFESESFATQPVQCRGGRFEVVLPSHGAMQVWVENPAEFRRGEIVVPDADDHELTLEFDELEPPR